MRTSLLALTLCLVLPEMCRAQATEDEQREACGPDVVQFCAAEIPHRARIAQCLEVNRARISPQCRAMLDGGRPAARGR
ncbi:MAG: hypothetical protein JWQ36_3291 [Enterovirga sp.]|jgi:hypothetical protein|nr:hypothetical protein [Enterovirga sp.]